MQQRQLRLGDILDDYCPRERRVTNHAVVAMVGEDVKQTRCTTCDAEHEYKHAKVPRQRRKSEGPAALYAQIAANAPKRVAHDPPPNESEGSTVRAHVEQAGAEEEGQGEALGPGEGAGSGEGAGKEAALAPDRNERADVVPPEVPPRPVAARPDDLDRGADESDDARADDEGPVHRPLIRASLPRPEGQQPPPRPFPEFTIRQPGGRPNRFRPRHQRGGGHQGHSFQGNRSNGNLGGQNRGPRPPSGRPGMMKRHGPPGRKRSK